MNLLSIGAGTCQIPLIETAKKMGIKTIAFDGRANAEGKDIADYFYQIDIKNIDECVKLAKKINTEIGIDTCLVMGVEACETVGAINDALGLMGITYKQADEMTNKNTRHRILVENFINCPKNWLLIKDYPCVIKPVKDSGARGVKFIKDESELQDCYGICEEYIDGRELSAEGYISAKDCFLLYVDRNYKHKHKFNPYMIEDGCSFPVIPPINYNRIITCTTKAIEAFHLRYTPVKFDIIIKDNIYYILEIAPRMSGGRLCSHIITKYVPNFIECVIGNSILSDMKPMVVEELIKSIHTVQRYYFPKDKPVRSHADRCGDEIATGNTYERALASVHEIMDEKIKDNPDIYRLEG